MADGLNFERVVAHYYEPLYQFAFSLTRAEADACDLTQQTFYVWATKGHQLRDPAKVKTWLFTTLHRQFLESRRRLQDRAAIGFSASAPGPGARGRSLSSARGVVLSGRLFVQRNRGDA